LGPSGADSTVEGPTGPTGPSGAIENPFSSVFTITNVTEAISTDTGALQVVGGVGIGGSLFVGQWHTLWNVSTATVQTFTGTPTGAIVYINDPLYLKPIVYNGTNWTDFSGNIII
jgi:hypothetical protein